MNARANPQIYGWFTKHQVGSTQRTDIYKFSLNITPKVNVGPNLDTSLV